MIEMMEIKDLPWDSLKIGESMLFTLEQSLYLSDYAFSNKEDKIAVKGDTIKMYHYPNYGLVRHPIYGFFRY